MWADKLEVCGLPVYRTGLVYAESGSDRLVPIKSCTNNTH